MQSGIREKAKYFYGIRDFTALRQAGFANIWLPEGGPGFGHGARELFSLCREIGKWLRPKNTLSDEKLKQIDQVSAVWCLLSNNNNNNNNNIKKLYSRTLVTRTRITRKPRQLELITRISGSYNSPRMPLEICQSELFLSCDRILTLELRLEQFDFFLQLQLQIIRVIRGISRKSLQELPTTAGARTLSGLRLIAN